MAQEFISSYDISCLNPAIPARCKDGQLASSARPMYTNEKI